MKYCKELIGGHQRCAICWFINSLLSPVNSHPYAHFTNGQVAMACPLCSGNSPCRSLIPKSPLISGKTPVQKSHLYKFTHPMGCLPAGLALLLTFQFSVQVSIGVEQDRSLHCWAERRKQGWQTQALHHDAWASPDSATSGCGGENWGFGQLGSSLRSPVGVRAQPSASNHHVGLFCTRPELLWGIWGPAFPSIKKLSAWKEAPLCYLWFLALSYFASGGEKNNNNSTFLWVGSVLGLMEPE